MISLKDEYDVIIYYGTHHIDFSQHTSFWHHHTSCHHSLHIMSPSIGSNIYVFNRFSVINIMSLWVACHKNSHSRDKCRINNLEWFSLNKIIIPPCIILFIKECCHVIILVLILSHCTFIFCLKKIPQQRVGYHLVVKQKLYLITWY
jgi:hypothetical protein